MPTQEEGIVNLDVKKEWKHEALHFTPWLAKNLDKLGKAIGVELECDQTEVQVGPFACDILATDVDSGAKVAIENQLELSDHGHLGQLLTRMRPGLARASPYGSHRPFATSTPRPCTG